MGQEFSKYRKNSEANLEPILIPGGKTSTESGKPTPAPTPTTDAIEEGVKIPRGKFIDVASIAFHSYSSAEIFKLLSLCHHLRVGS